MANKTKVVPKRIIEDILSKVSMFIISADFIVLDYEEDDRVPIILGSPFYDTGGVFKDVREGTLMMRFNNEVLSSECTKHSTHPHII